MARLTKAGKYGIKTNRIGLSIVANKKELQSIPEGLAIIDNPEELNCGIDAVMR